MPLELEIAVNRALMRARAAERALHDPAPWTLELAGHRVAAHRELGPDRITFTGVLPAPPPQHGHLVLRCGQDVVDIAELYVPVGAPHQAGAWTQLRHEIVVAA